MNETLKVRIEADVKDLEKGINSAEKEIDNLKDSIRSTQKEIKDATLGARGYKKAQDELNNEFKQGKITQKEYSDGLNRLKRDEKESQVEVRNLRNELNRLKASYKDIGGDTKNLSTEVGGLGKNTKANAIPALTSFSQVIQDAPYGIRGVANNIQQLTSQFGYLAASSGGAGNAVKALLSSLTGPAGILMAVSVVTSVLVTYGDKIFELIGTTNKLAEATKEYVGEAMAEASELKVLIDIANNHEASIVARRKAIEEINDKYGEYLGNIDEESIKTDKVKDSINQLTRALIQQAQIKGLKDVIGEETANAAEKLTGPMLEMREAATLVKQEIDNLIQSNDLLNKRLGNIQGVNNQIKAIEELGNEQSALGEIVRRRASGVQYAIGEYNKLNSEIKDITSNTADAIKPYQQLQQALTEKVFGITVVPEFDQEEIVIKGSKKGEAFKLPVFIDPYQEDIDLLESEKIVQEFDELVALIKEKGEGVSQAAADAVLAYDITPLEQKLGEAKEAFRQNLSMEEFFATNEMEWDAYLESMKSKTDIMQERAQLMGDIVGNMISNMSSALIDGKFSWEEFAKGVINSVGQIVAKLVAQAVTEKIIGKMQIKTDQGVANANAGVIATNAATALGPVGILALPGLLAGASGMVNAFYGGIGAFADGGIVGGHSYSGDKILARLNSGELILNQQQQAGVLAQMNSPSAMSGGVNPSFELGGGFVIEGDTIRMVLDRSDNKAARIG